MEHSDGFNEKSKEQANNGVPEKEKSSAAGNRAGSGETPIETLLHHNENGDTCGSDAGENAGDEQSNQVACLFDTIKRDEHGKLVIFPDSTYVCEPDGSAESRDFAARKDIAPLLKLLQERETPVYTMIAPAFSGQFSLDVTSGKLRSAFKHMGFYGMLEVALFADILTLKEALEFDRAIKDENDFVLTSCCCPMWVAMIRKSYSNLVPHVPPSVSPMVACGRSIKKMHPEAKTVFIGPCIAKKAEAREKDIADAVDFVLTFEETAELFKIMGIDPAAMPEDKSDHSSRAGRIYARSSGVSEAVRTTLERINPNRRIPLVSQHADGVPACKEMLKEIAEGHVHANFIEGMGCKGGCVGGPRSLIDRDEATANVNGYGDEAKSRTPADNPYVIETLKRLGFKTVESLLDRDNTFTRNF